MAQTGLNSTLRVDWTPLDERELFDSLQAGLDFHLGSVQKAVFEQAEDCAEKKVKEIFPQGVSDPKVLKRLTNSATTTGAIAFERTVDAIKSLPYWDDLRAKNQLIASDLVSRALKSDKNFKCNGCKKSLKVDIAIEISPMRSDSQFGTWHPACWVATAIREALQEFRSTKGALDKQAKSANAILNANEKFIHHGKFASGYSSGKKLIRDRMQFDHWIQGLYMEWDKSTTVKEEYRATYLNSFKEYAEQILEYLAKGSIPAGQTHVRLSKHLDEDIADSVVKRLLQVPIKTLRYLGLAYDPADSVGNIPQYLENKTSNPKSDAELDPELAWSERALCASTDPEAFFPELGGSTREAKKVCLACDVRVECLDYAMTHGERFGIWGGLSERERKRLARDYQPLKILNVATPKVQETRSSNFVLSTVHFQTFSDCKTIGEKFRENGAVIVNMSEAEEVERKSAIDFLSGMIFAQNGKIERITKDVFILTAENVHKSEKGSAHLNEPHTYEYIREQLLA